MFVFSFLASLICSETPDFPNNLVDILHKFLVHRLDWITIQIHTLSVRKISDTIR